MKMYLLLLTSLVLAIAAAGQQKPAYVLYNAKGKKVNYGKMMRQLVKEDIVLIGELHNNPIIHWLQLEITKDASEHRQLILGAEMFERDNQDALNKYLQGKLTAKGLDTTARLWNNYSTDYAPLVNFAKANKLPFIATNIPRRYASLVNRGGFAALDTLTAIEKSWMAPLPFNFDSTLPGYTNMLTMMGGHGSSTLVKAQASKDATMAFSILQSAVPGSLFIHYNGSYHSDNHDGIVWYLRKARTGVRVATISTVLQKDVSRLLAENKGKADYIVCVDEDMTTTY
jgi:uncharacterized iron-regulated protein